MKVRAKTTGVYVPAGHFNLLEGEEYEVGKELGEALVGAGVAEQVKDSRKGKKINAAPENKAIEPEAPADDDTDADTDSK